MLRRLVVDRVARERFRREATAAARLRHPHALQVFDQGETASGDPFLVSEYLDGPSLEQVLDEEEAVAPARARRWLEQLAGALGVAHEAGVVHRDVKPANVMLRGEDAMLCDFGLAQLEEVTGEVLESLTRTGQSVGTPLYMAPECLGGGPATPASDVWALGALGYRLVYGREWRQAELAKLILEARTLPPAPAERFGRFPDLDPALRAALHGNPRDRLDSAPAFLAVLAGAAAPEPPPAVPLASVAVAAPATGSRARLAIPGLVVLAAAAGLASGYLTRPPPPPTASVAPTPAPAPTTSPEPEALRKARRALDLAAPFPDWDIRRRPVNHLTVDLGLPTLEPTVPLAMRRLLQEALAASEAGASVDQAARAIARVAERVRLVDDYVADSLVSHAFEGGVRNFDSDAWRLRAEELRQLARDALASPGPEAPAPRVALHLAIAALANEPDLVARAEQAATRALDAAPEDVALLSAVVARALRRELVDEQLVACAPALRTLRRACLELPPSPARVQARRELAEACAWLLRIGMERPPAPLVELQPGLLDLLWEERDRARDEVAVGLYVARGWMHPRGFWQGKENPYAAMHAGIEERLKALRGKGWWEKPPPLPDPAW